MPAGVSAYTALANLTVAGTSTTTVTFSSIVGTYRDLKLVITGGKSTGAASYWRLNGDSTSTYSWVTCEANGTLVASGSNGNTYGGMNNSYGFWNSNVADAMFTMDILDYSATDKHKTVLSKGSGAAVGLGIMAVRWPSTAAITTLAITCGNTGVWLAGTTFTLYGMSA